MDAPPIPRLVDLVHAFKGVVVEQFKKSRKTSLLQFFFGDCQLQRKPRLIPECQKQNNFFVRVIMMNRFQQKLEQMIFRLYILYQTVLLLNFRNCEKIVGEKSDCSKISGGKATISRKGPTYIEGFTGGAVSQLVFGYCLI